MDAPARHRILLSLRSESALGLRLIGRGSPGEMPVQVTPADELTDDSDAGVRVQPMPVHRAVAVKEHKAVVQEPLPGLRSEMFGSERVSMKFAEMPSVVSLPVLSTDGKTASLSALNENQVRGCIKCRLCETRTQTVFGEGDVDASIFFIGEGPGEDEDRTGRPFVGRSGQLLEKMVIAMGLSRARVFIANIVKCRPPENRVPAPDEVETCTPYLVQQLEVVRPRAIVTLGLPAAKFMLDNPKITMGSVRGRWHGWRGIKLMPTYHPSYVLRNYTEATRAAVWSDLQQVMTEVGLAAVTTKRG